MATIGAGRIARLRALKGMTQRALAIAAGVSRQAVGAIESGRMHPSVDIALGLARALGSTVEDLFGPDSATSHPRRVAVATIRGREVSYRLERDHLAIEPAHSAAGTVFVGGCDLAIGLLARLATERSPNMRVLWVPMTNRAAMHALGRDRLHAAVVHARRDAHHERTDTRCVRFELAATQEGWIVAPGNPRKFAGATDLVRKRLRLANRPVGAEARAVLDAELRRAGVDAGAVAGYACQLPGQSNVGRAIAHGFADVAIGTAGVARSFGLGFIALRDERLSLVIPHASLEGLEGRALLGALSSPAYRNELAALATYDVANTGTEVA